MGVGVGVGVCVPPNNLKLVVQRRKSIENGWGFGLGGCLNLGQGEIRPRMQSLHEIV